MYASLQEHIHFITKFSVITFKSQLDSSDFLKATWKRYASYTVTPGEVYWSLKTRESVTNAAQTVMYQTTSEITSCCTLVLIQVLLLLRQMHACNTLHLSVNYVIHTVLKITILIRS